MDRLKLWARHGEAVRQAIALGERAHLETASAEGTEALLLGAIASGLLQRWAGACPDPRRAPEMTMAGRFPAPSAARCAGLSAMRHAGEVRRSARV